MNATEIIQAEWRPDFLKADYEKWYAKILLAANGILKIEGALGDESQSETVGDYDPITKKWIPGKHDKLVDLTEEQ